MFCRGETFGEIQSGVVSISDFPTTPSFKYSVSVSPNISKHTGYASGVSQKQWFPNVRLDWLHQKHLLKSIGLTPRERFSSFL